MATVIILTEYLAKPNVTCIGRDTWAYLAILRGYLYSYYMSLADGLYQGWLRVSLSIWFTVTITIIISVITVAIILLSFSLLLVL